MHRIIKIMVKNVSKVFSISKLLNMPIKITRAKLTTLPRFINISLYAKYSHLFLFTCGRCEILKTLIDAIVRKNCVDIVKHRL